MIKKALIITIFFLFLPVLAKAESMSSRLSGRILLDVAKNGEAWYVNPTDLKRYYLGRPSDAFSVMRELSLGISELDFQQIAQAGLPVDGNVDLAKKLSGRIVLQVEKNGEAWYINPVDLKKYYLGRPDDAFKIMRELGLGITQADLALIHKPGLSEAIDGYSNYESRRIDSDKGTFAAEMVTVSLDDPHLKIITDTADSADCDSNCQAKSLADYVFGNQGFAGINATYFCASAGCQAPNYYFFPVYNTDKGVLINEDQLKYWTTGPIMAFDTDNNFYYFKDSRDFKSVADFEKGYGVKLQAAIGNKPRLIEDGMNALIDWEVDPGQRDGKYLRNAIAYVKGENGSKGKIIIMVLRSATLDDLASVLKALKVDYALNLDGGSSAALIYNGEYMIGPGRNVPNAIIFSQSE